MKILIPVGIIRRGYVNLSFRQVKYLIQCLFQFCHIRSNVQSVIRFLSVTCEKFIDIAQRQNQHTQECKQELASQNRRCQDRHQFHQINFIPHKSMNLKENKEYSCHSLRCNCCLIHYAIPGYLLFDTSMYQVLHLQHHRQQGWHSPVWSC